MFSLELPHRGDSNEYTERTFFIFFTDHLNFTFQRMKKMSKHLKNTVCVKCIPAKCPESICAIFFITLLSVPMQTKVRIKLFYKNKRRPYVKVYNIHNHFCFHSVKEMRSVQNVLHVSKSHSRITTSIRPSEEW